MINLDGVKRSLGSISPYPWSFDGYIDVLDRNRERVAERKGFQRVGDVNAVFIATAPTVIKQLACEVERLRALIIAHRDGCNCDETQSETPPRQCDACFALYAAVEDA